MHVAYAWLEAREAGLVVGVDGRQALVISDQNCELDAALRLIRADLVHLHSHTRIMHMEHSHSEQK